MLPNLDEVPATCDPVVGGQVEMHLFNRGADGGFPWDLKGKRRG